MQANIELRKFHGLDAPKRSEITGKDGQPLLEQLVQQSYEAPQAAESDEMKMIEAAE